MENLKGELDETRLSEKQLRHKVDHQKEIIAAKSEELHMMSERVHETMSSEMLNLQIELTELESVKVCDYYLIIRNIDSLKIKFCAFAHFIFRCFLYTAAL